MFVNISGFLLQIFLSFILGIAQTALDESVFKETCEELLAIEFDKYLCQDFNSKYKLCLEYLPKLNLWMQGLILTE